MRVSACSLAVLGFVLAGCSGGSGSNPFGSLGSLSSGGSGGSLGSGGSSGSGSLGSGGSIGSGGGNAEGETEAERREAIRVADDDSIVLASIDQAILEPALNGTILRVTTTAPTQGYHSGRLSPVGRGDVTAEGLLLYEVRAIPPEEVQATGPARTRQVIVATFIPEDIRDAARAVRIISRGRIIELAL